MTGSVGAELRSGMDVFDCKNDNYIVKTSQLGLISQYLSLRNFWLGTGCPKKSSFQYSLKKNKADVC